MGKSVFISYSHQQSDWVRNDLQAILIAAGLTVYIDKQDFTAGRNLKGEMDKLQDLADYSILVFSPDYLTSKACQYEMQCAIAKDPQFTNGNTIALLREVCDLPGPIKQSLYISFDSQQAKQAEPWDQLLNACGQAQLNTSPPEWLTARRELRGFLEQGYSVNLVTDKNKPEWRALLNSLTDIPCIDLDSGETAARHRFINRLLQECGCSAPIAQAPDDLYLLESQLGHKSSPCYLILEHFERALDRLDYGWDNNFYSALRHLIMEKRKLVLVIQSHTHFANLLPQNNPISYIDIKTIELNGRNKR